MHTEILSENQKKLLLFLSIFKKDYFLVGGTAIALHLGHRESIDFDLFTTKNVKRKTIKNILEKENINYTILHEASDQLHIVIDGVKFTFFNYPFTIEHKLKFENYISIPNLSDLAAMKAYALGGRAKWKDYVDTYFILKQNISLNSISEKAKSIFHEKFNKKLFHQQLSYFDDINYSEPIIYVGHQRPSEQEIKDFLTEQALIEF